MYQTLGGQVAAVSPASAGGAMTENVAYEVRLSGSKKSSVQFVTVSPDEDTAEKYARALLARFPEYNRAEVWAGMKLIRDTVIGPEPNRA